MRAARLPAIAQRHARRRSGARARGGHRRRRCARRAGHALNVLAEAVSSYTGPPKPTAASSVTAWTFDVPAVLFCVLILCVYAAGLLVLRRRGEAWPVMRSVSWLAGVGFLFVSTCGWTGVYGQVLIVAFTTQFLLLLLIVPLLLAWGRPISLAARTLPPPWGGRASGIVTGPVGSVVTHPAVAPLLVPVVTFGVFFTPVLQNVLLHKGSLQLLRVALVLAGFLFALPLSGEDGALSSLGVMLGLFVGLVELIVDAVPGFTWRYKDNVFASGWVARVGRPWAPTPIHDQHLAANVLWIIAELLDLPFVALTFRRWVKVDEQEARRLDAVLDSRPVTPAAGVVAAVGPTVDDDGMETPWWEKDSRFIDPSRTAAYRADGVRRRAATRHRPPPDSP